MGDWFCSELNMKLTELWLRAQPCEKESQQQQLWLTRKLKRASWFSSVTHSQKHSFSKPRRTLKNKIKSIICLCALRWFVTVADSVAGGGEAGRGFRMPQAVCVLPHAHDGQLPVPEPLHGTSRRALRLSTGFPAEQPHHRASRGLVWLRDPGDDGGCYQCCTLKWLSAFYLNPSIPLVSLNCSAGALALRQQHHVDWGRSVQ